MFATPRLPGELGSIEDFHLKGVRPDRLGVSPKPCITVHSGVIDGGSLAVVHRDAAAAERDRLTRCRR